MALRLGALEDALIDAGAGKDKARQAAEELAGYENRLATLDTKMTALDGRVQLIQWMLAFNLGVSLTVLWRVFS